MLSYLIKNIKIPLWFFILNILLVLILNFSRSEKDLNISDISCILNASHKNIIKYNEHFFSQVHLDPNNKFWNLFVEKYQINTKNIEENGFSFESNYEYAMNINIIKKNNHIYIDIWPWTNVTELLAIPVKINLSKNNMYENLIETKPINLPIKGKFISYDQYLFRENNEWESNNDVTYYTKLMSLKEYNSLHVEYPNWLNQYLICNRQGEILFFSNSLKNLFSINSTQVNSINDLYQFLSLDEENYKCYLNDAINSITFLRDHKTTIINLKNSTYILKKYSLYKNNIWIGFEDISKLVNNNCEKIYNLVNESSDLFFCFDKSKRLIWTNNNCYKNLDYNQLKIYLKSYGEVEEKTIDNNIFLIAKFDIRTRLEDLKGDLKHNIGLVAKLFEYLSDLGAGKNLREYIPYMHFLFAKFHNIIEYIDIIYSKNTQTEQFNLYEFTNEKINEYKTKVNKQPLLHYKLDESTQIRSHKVYMNIIMDLLLSIIFELNDYENCHLEVYKEEDIKILLTNIPNKSMEKFCNLLNKFQCSYGTFIIDSVENQCLTMGFVIKNYK